MSNFPTIAATFELETAHGLQGLAECTQMRVLGAAEDATEQPANGEQIRQDLVDDVTAAPGECLNYAIAELRALAAHLWANEAARGGFLYTGVESTVMEDELASLATNPYRYAAQQCDPFRSSVEHLKAAFGLVLVMALAWPVEDSCPVCSYLEDQTPDEPVLLLSPAPRSA